MPTGTTVTLRPNESFNQGDWWSFAGGASSIHGATSDNSVGTYAMTTGNPGWVGVTNLPPIPPGARIVSVTIRVEWSGDNSAYGAVGTVDNLTQKTTPHIAFYRVPSARYVHTFPAMTVRPGGGVWTIDAVNHISVHVQGNTTAVKFYEVYADVLYNEKPVVSNVGPSGTIVVQQPTIGFVYSDPDGDPQERWQVRLFTAAQAAASGFNPASSAAVADSGTAYQSAARATSWTPPRPLSPGVYKAYVRAADAGSGGRYSDWASSQFTVVGDPPAPPAVLSVTADPVRGRVEVKIRQTDNFLNVMTATADGVTGERFHWYNFGNFSSPSTTTGGLTGNAGTATVQATGEAALFGVVLLRAIPTVTHIWAGWIKADAAGGIIHVDAVWFDSSGSFIRMDEGSAVSLTTTFQSSEGRAVAPDNAYGVYLMWRSTGTISAGRVLKFDDVGIWPTRADAFLAGLESRLIDAENGVVDLQIRVAALEGVPPRITIEPSDAPLDATAYRGGLDSSNLLGPVDASFPWTLAGTHWTAVGTGSLSAATDPAGYEGYALHYAPGTVGGSHTLELDYDFPLPDVAADYQFQFRHRANTTGLTADAFLVWRDGNAADVGAPVAAGRVELANSSTFTGPVVVSATPPSGATHFRLRLVLAGEAATADRWIFDRFQVARLPLVPPDTSFGYGPFGFGPFGYGPFGGSTTATQGPVLAWKPASQVDVYPLVEYSTDGGDTWSGVRLTERAVYDPVTRIARVYDYEAPLGKPVLYRARTAARDYQLDPTSGVLIVSAPTSTREVTLTVDGYYVIDPFTQQRIRFDHSAPGGSAVELKMETARPTADFSPVGSRYRLVVHDVEKGGTFAWRITLADAAAVETFSQMLATGHTLLVQTPTGSYWYVKPGAARNLTSVWDGDRDHGGVIEFSGFEQARPV